MLGFKSKCKIDTNELRNKKLKGEDETQKRKETKL